MDMDKAIGIAAEEAMRHMKIGILRWTEAE